MVLKFFLSLSLFQSLSPLHLYRLPFSLFFSFLLFFFDYLSPAYLSLSSSVDGWKNCCYPFSKGAWVLLLFLLVVEKTGHSFSSWDNSCCWLHFCLDSHPSLSLNLSISLVSEKQKVSVVFSCFAWVVCHHTLFPSWLFS